MNINSELDSRRNQSLASLIETGLLMKERNYYQKLRNLEQLPDYSDHCTLSYLEKIALIHKLANTKA